MLAIGKGTNTVVITLRDPVQCFCSPEEIPFSSTVWFSGIPACVEETPFWIPADILYEKDTRCFVGVTYEITAPDRELARAKQMAESLAPQIANLNDFSNRQSRAPYPKSVQDHPYFEIVWKATDNVVYECAQLEYGAWQWFYPANSLSIGFDDPQWTPPLGFGICNLQEILQAFDLRFPDELDFPELDFRSEAE